MGFQQLLNVFIVAEALLNQGCRSIGRIGMLWVE